MLRRRSNDGQLTWVGKAVRSLGLGRLAYYCFHRPRKAWRDARLPGHPVEKDLFGYQLQLPAPNRNDCFAQIYSNSVWEPAVTAEVRRRVKPGMNVADIGADIGYYVLLFASLTPAGVILAFEPNPFNFPFLAETVRRNRLENVKLFPFVLGQFYQPAVRFSGDRPENNDEAHRESGPAEPYTTEIRVLDDVVSNEGWPRLDFVLMDVEGAEMQVLLGMEQTIRRDRPMLLIELHGPMMSAFDSSKAGLIEWLRQRGYGVEWVDGEAVDSPGFTHALFLPGAAI